MDSSMSYSNQEEIDAREYLGVGREGKFYIRLHPTPGRLLCVESKNVFENSRRHVFIHQQKLLRHQEAPELGLSPKGVGLIYQEVSRTPQVSAHSTSREQIRRKRRNKRTHLFWYCHLPANPQWRVPISGIPNSNANPLPTNKPEGTKAWPHSGVWRHLSLHLLVFVRLRVRLAHLFLNMPDQSRKSTKQVCLWANWVAYCHSDAILIRFVLCFVFFHIHKLK